MGGVREDGNFLNTSTTVSFSVRHFNRAVISSCGARSDATAAGTTERVAKGVKGVAGKYRYMLCVADWVTGPNTV